MQSMSLKSDYLDACGKLFLYETAAERFNNPVVDGAPLFSLVEFGRKDRENNQSAPSLGKSLRQRKRLQDSSF